MVYYGFVEKLENNRQFANDSVVVRLETIYSPDRPLALRALYHSALQKYHQMRKELNRRIAFNKVEKRKTKQLPITLLQRQVARARLDVLNAKKAYSPFNTLDISCSVSTNSSSHPAATEEAEFRSGIAFDKPLLNFSDYSGGGEVKWSPWPEEAKSVDFVSVMKGFGDGEQRIAFIFGGSMMGGNKSYDVLIRGHGKWEVKDLTNDNEIRPGTQGTRAYSVVQTRIISAFIEMSKFIEDAFLNDSLECATVRERRTLMYIRDFVNANYALIVEAGEVSKSRFLELRKVVTYVSQFKQKRESDVVHALLTDDFFIEDLDHRTYVSIAKQLAKSNNVVAARFDRMDLALENLKDEMFDDPDELVKLVETIKPSNIFGTHADGLILVHREQGFIVLDNHVMDDVIVFDQITQSKPKFKLALKKEKKNENYPTELSDRTVSDVPGGTEDSGSVCQDVLQV